MLRLISAIIFILAFCLISFAQEPKPKTDGVGNGSGRGQGNGSGNSQTDVQQIPQIEKQPITPESNRGVRILSKPRANYTDLARQNQVQGKVVLRVAFKKDGKIGKIKVVNGLPYGLSQNAIEAGKKIKFEPQIKNGKPITATKNIEYSFTIY